MKIERRLPGQASGFFCYVKNVWKAYQTTLNQRKTRFYKIITLNNQNPRVLFNTINSILNKPQSAIIEASVDTCNHFVRHFDEKSELIR